MRLLRSVAAMTAWSQALQRQNVLVGLVPTMGALHAGHAALIRAARLSCDAVVVSLFVNPLQFDEAGDLARYPRTLPADRRLCARAGVDVLFAPSAEAMYPPGFQTRVVPSDLARRWEGERRPGHFTGVATVVTKLFGIVRPQRAFFGQKDYQQSLLVRRVAQDLNLGVEIVVHPTVRERDGLALSSRNRHLSPGQRRLAPLLYRALRAGQAAVQRGERSAGRVQRVMQRTLQAAGDLAVEYLAVCDPETLEPVRAVRGRVVLLGAIRLGAVRLIDNVLAAPPAG